MRTRKITGENHTSDLQGSADSAIVRGKFWNELVDDLQAHVPADGVGRFTYLVPFNDTEGIQIRGGIVDPNYVTAMVLTAADSGKILWIQGDNAASAIVLPPAVHGLHFKMIWAANNNEAITVTTADTTDTTGDMFRGGVLVCSAAAVNTFVEASGNINRMTFDDNVNNCASGAGSWVEFTCVDDGIWIVTGVMNGNTDIDGVGSAIFSDVD